MATIPWGPYPELGWRYVLRRAERVSHAGARVERDHRNFSYAYSPGGIPSRHTSWDFPPSTTEILARHWYAAFPPLSSLEPVRDLGCKHRRSAHHQRLRR